MNLSEQLQNASDLAQLSDVIIRLRLKEPLVEEDRAFLKEVLWPWWYWILRQRGGSEPDPKNGRTLIFKMFDGSEAVPHKPGLDALCDHLWFNQPLDVESALALAVELRTRLLMRVSRQF